MSMFVRYTTENRRSVTRKVFVQKDTMHYCIKGLKYICSMTIWAVNDGVVRSLHVDW